ncbi:MAG TPA: hypothetical protein PLA13_08920 [Microbacteriaceae bacterium]|nr:hypothetical protein [Microbacteriaceae bacterium]
MDTGGNPMALGVGDLVSDSGVYTEPFGTSEISDAAVVIEHDNAGLPFAPKPMLPADVATGGVQAEPHESMLLIIDKPGSLAIIQQNADMSDFDEFLITASTTGCLPR